MKKYKSKEIVYAEQYFNGKSIDGVVIGKNDPYNRWDDTPHGPYIQVEQFKYRVNDGDWIIKNPNDDKFLDVLSNDEFIRKYELK